MNIIKKRRIFLTVSAIATVISIISLLLFRLNLSIDFTGGSRLEVAPNAGSKITKEQIENAYSSKSVNVYSIQQTEGGYRVSSALLSDSSKDAIVKKLNAKERSFEVLGPTIGNETRNKALFAVFISIIAITSYIAFAFRKSGGQISSWKFGVSAIVALMHDVVVTLGLFSIFGVLFGVQVDVLFITAILTIMGFSVHDTIVVFDRIRENITNNIKGSSFETIINNSITETVARSLNTSITVVFVLFTMALFGGETIRWFIIAFMIGVIIGTYSSIFIASPLLLEWHNFDQNGGFKKLNSVLRKRFRGK